MIQRHCGVEPSEQVPNYENGFGLGRVADALVARRSLLLTMGPHKYALGEKVEQSHQRGKEGR